MKNGVNQHKYILKVKKIREANIEGSTVLHHPHVERKIPDILICNMSKVIIWIPTQFPIWLILKSPLKETIFPKKFLKRHLQSTLKANGLN